MLPPNQRLMGSLWRRHCVGLFPPPLPVTYHIIGLNCPDLPRQLMGTRHGVTWFPDQSNCDKCRAEWNRRVDSRVDRVHDEDDGLPEFEDDHIAIPRMTLTLVPR